ncbi:MAG: hypothetical protein QXR79_04950 [Candidatus Bathyarchaeia archaeon]
MSLSKAKIDRVSKRLYELKIQIETKQLDGLVRGFADKFSDLDVVVLLK